MQELFFDKVLRYYNPERIRKFLSAVSEESELQIRYKAQQLRMHQMLLEETGISLRDLMLFLVNGAVIDDLFHVKAESRETEALKLPFPAMFFEPINPLEISLSDGEGFIKGMLLSKRRYANAVEHPFLNLYFVDKHGNPKSFSTIAFNPQDFSDVSNLTAYKYADRKNTQSFDRNLEALQNEIAIDDNNARYVKDFCSLAINLIDYINAHNVTIRRVERGPEGRRKRINRKRAMKGKKILDPLMPYYWIEIRQHVIDDEVWTEDECKMNYREWVRGHFRRYHTRDGIESYWIEPYVRGPEGMPWKENRYKVLDGMLKKGPKY
jgi:hypothetical protein